jgi:lipopolysaccharide export system protein LptA
MNTKIGTYYTGGTVVKDSAILKSDSGFYYVNKGTAYFRGNVKVKHPDFRLAADTLEYKLNEDIAVFHGPTYFFQEKDKRSIYCEAGYYSIKTKYAVFEKNAWYQSPKETAIADKIIVDDSTHFYHLIGNAYYEDSSKIVEAEEIHYNKQTKSYSFNGNPVFREKGKTGRVTSKRSNYEEDGKVMHFYEDVVVVDSAKVLKADTLHYNKVTHIGNARNHVYMVDSVNKTILYSDWADYNDSTGYLFATKRPVLVSIDNKDSMWVRADTFISVKQNPKDSIRDLFGFKNVRMYKKDMQASCDSLAYIGKDSVYYFYRKPIIWSDSSQFTADSINAKMKNKELEKVNLIRHSFIINTPDSVMFNQIKGKNITTYFKKKQARIMDVFKEGETIYYLQDEAKAYTGVDRTTCRDMKIIFGDNKVDRIKFYSKPDGKISPMGTIDHKTYRIDGFNWLEKLRPKSKWDIFNFGLKTGMIYSEKDLMH